MTRTRERWLNGAMIQSVILCVHCVCAVIVDPLLGKEREPRLTLLARAKVKWSVWHSIPVKHWMNEWTHRWVKLFDLADSTQLFPFVFPCILIWLFRGDWFDCRLEFYCYYCPRYLTWFAIFPLFYGCLTTLPSVCSHCSLLWTLLRWSNLPVSTPIFFLKEVHPQLLQWSPCFSLVFFSHHPNCIQAVSKDLQSSLVDREVWLDDPPLPLLLLRWVWFGVRLLGFKPQLNT